MRLAKTEAENHAYAIKVIQISFRSWMKLFNAVIAPISLSRSISSPSPPSSPTLTRPSILIFPGLQALRIRQRLLVVLKDGHDGETSSFSRKICRALRTLRKMLLQSQSSKGLAKTMRRRVLLGQLNVVIPSIRSIAETVSLRNDIKEHEEAFFYTNILLRGARLGVFEDPVGQLNEGKLVHMAEFIETIRNAIEEISCSVCACATRHGHLRRVKFLWIARSVSGETGGEVQKRQCRYNTELLTRLA